VKKVLRVAAWVVAGLLVVVFGGGLLLSPKWEVARSRVIAAPPESIHAYVGDLEKWPVWSPFEKEDPAIVIECWQPSAGVGAKRSWRSEKVGNGSQTITASDPAKGLTIRLDIEGFPSFDAIFDYEPVSGGTRVTWTDRGDAGGNPLNRWFSKLMEPMMGPTFERGLADLDAVVTARR
jgi:carbon monoxide dehydrogenase subunit G